MLFGEKTMIAKHIVRAVHVIGLMAGLSIIWTANVNGQSIHPPIRHTLARTAASSVSIRAPGYQRPGNR
jgi:hypothetical protein